MQRFIRFIVSELSDEMWVDVVKDTDLTAKDTARVDAGTATVGYRYSAVEPPVVAQLDSIGALVPGPSGEKTWSHAEVLAALPVGDALS